MFFPFITTKNIGNGAYFCVKPKPNSALSNMR